MELPLERMRWLEPGDSFDAGDRTLHLFKPPIFDGPTTRGLYDPTTAAMWIVDSFASSVPTRSACYDVRTCPEELYDEAFPLFNSLISPWHQWLDPAAYGRHVDEVEALGVLTVASAHGPVLTGDSIHDAFDRVRALAGQPIIAGTRPGAARRADRRDPGPARRLKPPPLRAEVRCRAGQRASARARRRGSTRRISVRSAHRANCSRLIWGRLMCRGRSAAAGPGR